MSSYQKPVNKVSEENRQTLMAVNSGEVQKLIDEIGQEKSVQFYVMERMRLLVKRVC